jgi:hypothetical protein
MSSLVLLFPPNLDIINNLPYAEAAVELRNESWEDEDGNDAHPTDAQIIDEIKTWVKGLLAKGYFYEDEEEDGNLLAVAPILFKDYILTEVPSGSSGMGVIHVVDYKRVEQIMRLNP